jgi:hypothetical protein
MMIRKPAAPADLQLASKAVKSRVRRVLANLEAIDQQQNPILVDPRAVWLDITLSIIELESALCAMKRAWREP